MIYPKGTRVILSKRHPHSEEVGTVIGHEVIMDKTRHRIKLDNCKHGGDECFAMKIEDIKVI